MIQGKDYRTNVYSKEIKEYVCKIQYTSRSFSVLRMHNFGGAIPLFIQHCNKECLLLNATLV